MRRALLAVALVLALAGAAAAYLLLSAGGLRWLVGAGLVRAPAEVSLDAVHGRAVGPIVLEGIHARWDGGEVRIARLELDWRPWRSLREGRLLVSDVRVQKVRVRLSAASGPGSSAGAPVLPAVRVDGARLDDLELDTGDGTVRRVERIEFTGESDAGGVRIERLFAQAPQARVEAQGGITLADGIGLDLRTTWDAEPSAGKTVHGEGSVRGGPDALDVVQELSGVLEGDVRARVTLGAAPAWEASGHVARLDAAAFAPAVPALVSEGEWSAAGAGERLRVQARATVAGIAQSPARLDTAFTLEQGRWGIERLRMVDAAGVVLAEASGEYAAGDLRLVFRSSDLAFDGVGWSALEGEVAWNEKAATPIVVSATARGLALGPVSGVEARIAASGTRERFSGRVEAKSARGDEFEQSFDGDVRGGETRLTLRDGRASAPEVGKWSQVAAVTARIAAAGGELGRGCWQAGDAQACLEARWTRAGEMDANLDLANIDLALFQEWFEGRDMHIEGAARGGGRITVRNGAIESGAFDFQVSDARLERIGDGVLSGTRALVQVKGTARIEADAADARVDIDLGEHGTATAALKLAPPARPGQAWSERALSGSVRAGVPDLAVLAQWIAVAAQPAGALEADLQIDGTLAQPRVGGSAHVRDASIYAPRLGTELKHLQFDLESARDQGMSFRASADAGAGRVELDGTVRVVSARDWEVRLRATGESAQLANLPWLSLVLSPALDVTVRPGAVEYAGKVRVDRAEIGLNDLGGGATQSEDVVVIGAAEPRSPAWITSGQLELQLGKDVRVSGFGFDGLVDGSLSLAQKPGARPTGRGVLNVREGSFEAFGARLTVESGSLLFPGVSLDDAHLNAVAVRPRLSTRVGVIATGPLRAPELRLFSDEPMEDTEILAWLLTGSSSSNADAAQAGALLSAAREMGLGGAEGMAQDFAARLGIEEVSVGAAEKGEGGLELRLGRRLLPKLFLSYVVGLSETINAIELRYFLRPQWTVSTRTSPAGAEVEIGFTVER